MYSIHCGTLATNTTALATNLMSDTVEITLSTSGNLGIRYASFERIPVAFHKVALDTFIAECIVEMRLIDKTDADYTVPRDVLCDHCDTIPDIKVEVTLMSGGMHILCFHTRNVGSGYLSMEYGSIYDVDGGIVRIG